MERKALLSAQLACMFLLLFALSACSTAILAIRGATSGYTAYEIISDLRGIESQVEDPVIKVRIRSRFDKIEKLKDLPVDIFVYDGHVYLVGQVEGVDQADRMAALARGVNGVRQVTTYLLRGKGINIDALAADALLSVEVKAKLISQAGVNSTQIDVKTVQGNVVLMGIVGSSVIALKAEQLARETSGVVQVKNYLQVR